MTGLRERQKADRTRRILEAASRLFRDTGYGAIRIEDIASAAEVSVGTLYNYFENKGDLLLAIVSMEVEEVLEHSLYYLSKETWRTAMAISIEAPGTPFSARYTELDGMLAQQVCDLIVELQRRGHVRADIDAPAMGQVIFNNLNQMFIEFVKQDDMSFAHLHATTARQNAPLADLLTAR
jgi:AcrR family transcriptional regulator